MSIQKERDQMYSHVVDVSDEGIYAGTIYTHKTARLIVLIIETSE